MQMHAFTNWNSLLNQIKSTAKNQLRTQSHTVYMQFMEEVSYSILATNFEAYKAWRFIISGIQLAVTGYGVNGLYLLLSKCVWLSIESCISRSTVLSLCFLVASTVGTVWEVRTGSQLSFSPILTLCYDQHCTCVL
jgi:hypothetical protein